MLTTNKIPRSSVIDLMIRKNAKLDRSQLEKLTDDALVKQARADVPELSSLSVDMLQGVGEFPLNPNFGWQSRVARPESLEHTLEEAVRSSAPYSKGSSDQAMLSYPSNDLINKHHDVVIRNLFTPERFTKRERFPRLMRVVRKTRDLLWR
jgi:hypothetical protein